jgi:hypothetical protein
VVLQSKIENGERGFIDPRYKNHSYIESKLVEILELCWVHDAKERVDIFTVVDMLRELKKSTLNS